jgi:manganese transport protein
MHGFHISRTNVASGSCFDIVALNGKLVYDEITGWLEASENPIVLWLTVVPLALSFLIYYCISFLSRLLKKSKIAIQNHSPHNLKLKFSKSDSYTKKDIAVSDFSSADEIALNSAIELEESG